MITIINYNMGNLNSVANMIKKIGYDARITSDYHEIERAEKLILPGVGAFDRGMENLQELCLIDAIKECVLVRGVPILGICLGMQLMTNRSEEGILPGLSLIDAETKKFLLGDGYKVPHMGWNTVSIEKKSKLFYDMEDQENRFYFVHSYYVHCSDAADVLCSTRYGITFTAMFEHKNIIGAQCHPEKSHKFGMQLLKNFVEMY